MGAPIAVPVEKFLETEHFPGAGGGIQGSKDETREPIHEYRTRGVTNASWALHSTHCTAVPRTARDLYTGMFHNSSGTLL